MCDGVARAAPIRTPRGVGSRSGFAAPASDNAGEDVAAVVAESGDGDEAAAFAGGALVVEVALACVGAFLHLRAPEGVVVAGD